MFRAKTVLVVGAGASVEVGLPAGPELLRQITKLTHITFDHYQQKTGDNAILEALKIILNEGGGVKNLNEHLHAGWQLSESAKQALSIDNVIDALEDDKVELIGKLGIVRAILNAEKSSTAFKRVEDHDDAINLTKFDETWYSSLTKLLTENVRKSEIGNIFENLEIINFNYDRCLEHYLPYSLAGYYGVQPQAVREIMQGLTIHRPYGVAGKLPWQKGKAPSVPFGGGGAQDLAKVVEEVRTFTERVEEGTELEAMRNAITVADRVFFLGFAFHRQNVELLSSGVQDHAEILATTLGISQSDQLVIDGEIRQALAPIEGSTTIKFADMPCNQFFKDYWRTLTAQRNY